MSTQKHFRLLVNLSTNIKVTKCILAVSHLRDTVSPPFAGGETTLDEESGVTLFITGDPEDFYYVTVKVLEYKVQESNDGSYSAPVNPPVYNPDSPADAHFLAVFNYGDDEININPLSTVASVFCYTQRIQAAAGEQVTIAGSKDYRLVAYAMKKNFYKTEGGISEVMYTPPNSLQTNSFPAYNFLSGLMYYSFTNATVFTGLLSQVNTIPGVQATSALGAIIAIAQHPFDVVEGIYNITGNKQQIYVPSLPQLAQKGVEPVPDQWTLAVKINNSGSENFLIAGTAFTVFDKENKAWVTNNFRQGSDRSGSHCMVFHPDGKPTEFSPIMGGGILGPGFGVAISPDGETIAFGNYGWGPQAFNPVKGSISVFSYKGEVKSPPGGFTNKTCRIQGLVYDKSGNLWMASWGTQAPMATPGLVGIYNVPSEPSAVVCYLGGDPEKAILFNEFGKPSEYHGTFAVAIDQEGYAIVSNAGTAGKMESSVYKVGIVDDEHAEHKKRLKYEAHWISDYVGKNPDQIPYFEEFRQPTIDHEGYVYVGGVTSGRVVKLDQDLNYVTAFTENIHGPWGITFDSTGKKFITGFGQQKEGVVNTKSPDSVGPFGITIVESDDTDWTNTKIMTLPTGGDPVLLANGQPLYGNQEGRFEDQIPESYKPLMRVTSTSIDRAGNLWCANNWKPSLYVDVNSNPGGDGVVIFVGVAEPLV